MVRLAGVSYNSLCNGPGMRTVFFFQGCAHNCPECFNPETHDFNLGQEVDELDIIDAVTACNTMDDGFTFSGGDPIYQTPSALNMAHYLKAKFPNKTIWLYTGFTWDQLLRMSEQFHPVKDLLFTVDVIVDGMFIKSLAVTEDTCYSCRLRGSTNQRIINTKESLKQGEIVEYVFE